MVQHADLCEDVELGKLVGLFFIAVGVSRRSLGDKLAAGVFVIVVVADMG